MIGSLSPGKRIIKKKQFQKQYEGHIKRVQLARPNTTGWQWQYDPPILSKKKRQMIEGDKITQIQRQNKHLLERITVNAAIKRPNIDNDTDRMNKSLNSSFRRKQMQSIDVQNIKLLKRLHQRKSQYNTSKMKQEWKKQKQVIKNIALFPFIIKDGSRRYKKKAVSKLQTTKNDVKEDINSLSGDIQMVRLRNINGVNLIITIKLKKQTLQIVGQDKKTQMIKIIQIPRKEAMEFIEIQCKGKIQHIFDLVYFDNQKGILYLISKGQIQAYKEQIDKIGPLVDIQMISS